MLRLLCSLCLLCGSLDAWRAGKVNIPFMWDHLLLLDALSSAKDGITDKNVVQEHRKSYGIRMAFGRHECCQRRREQSRSQLAPEVFGFGGSGQLEKCCGIAISITCSAS